MENFEEQFNKTLNDWRKSFEEFRVQFALGKMDAAWIFEKQKEHFKTWLHSFKEQIDKTSGVAKENADMLKAKIDELLLQIDLGKSDGKDFFEEEKKKIETAMNDLLESAKKIFGTGYEKMLGMYESNSQSFKTGLEILNLQFALGKMDSKDEIEKIKKEMAAKMESLNENMKKMQQLGKENMEEWNAMMKENYEKLKSFAESWIKK